jgi:hypothetical protein
MAMVANAMNFFLIEKHFLVQQKVVELSALPSGKTGKLSSFFAYKSTVFSRNGQKNPQPKPLPELRISQDYFFCCN